MVEQPSAAGQRPDTDQGPTPARQPPTLVGGWNRVMVVGEVSRGPRSGATRNGTPVADFTCATPRSYTMRDGTERIDVTYVDCRLYGHRADPFCREIGLGDAVLLEGRLQWEHWEGPDGQPRGKHVIVVERHHPLTVGGGQARGSER